MIASSRSLLVATMNRTSTLIVSIPPSLSKRPFLKDPQQFGLGGKGHVPDLVEKDRSSLALLQFSDPAGDGAR